MSSSDKKEVKGTSVHLTDVNTTEPLEMFTPTFHFRWLKYETMVDITCVKINTKLQQMHQGNLGTQNWEDVPTIDETK